MSEGEEKSTITAEIKSHAYGEISELVKDVDTAISTLSGTKQEPQNSLHAMSAIPSQQDLAFVAFKAKLGDLLRRELVQRPEDLKLSETNGAPGLKQDTQDEKPKPLSGVDIVGRSVLTLYGSAPHPRQLFSGIQGHKTRLPLNTSLESGIDIASDYQHTNSASLPPLRESSLPNGIVTTKIIPIHSVKATDSRSKAPTIGDLFAPSASLPTLQPPKQSKHTSTRSQSVHWYNPAEMIAPTKSRGKETYTSQSLSTGQWLKYNSASSSAQMSSPEAKRKQRDRALSVGEPKAPLPQGTVEAIQQAKDDALFRSAYSSFAPDHDDAAAIVPERLKARMWWGKISESVQQEPYPFDNETSMEEPVEAKEAIDGVDDDVKFKEVVENWTPEDVPYPFRPSVNSSDTGDEDVEGVLQEVSELLETLSSYQRNRLATLAVNARSSTGQDSELTSMTGSPSTPSSAEVEIYNTLKTSISLLVGKLPPYAVARLNGNQLAELSISTKIPVESKNYMGTMETHDLSNGRQAGAIGTVASSAVRTSTSGTVPPVRASNYYQPSTATPTPRPSYTAPRPSIPATQYSSQQYSGRPLPASHYSAPGNYTASQSTPAPNRQYSSHYGYQTPHPNQYVNGQRPPPTNGYYGSQYAVAQNTVPAPQTPQYQQRPSQPGYQQRAQNSMAYNYGSMPNGRSTSPQNPSTYHSAYHRPSYSTPVPNSNHSQTQPGTPVSRPSSVVTAANVGAAQANNSVPTTIGQQLNMSAEEQAALMNRQKQQLVAQQMRMRQDSGTPQPLNGQAGGQVGGTPIAQTNGLTEGHGP